MFSVPLIIAHYGLDQFGLIALVYSFNLISFFLDNGFKAAGIKQISELRLLKKDFDLWKLSISSLLFYFLIGVINSLVLIFVYFTYENFISIEDSNKLLFGLMIIVSIVSSPITWIINYFNQVLIASKKISTVNYFKLIQSVFYVISVLFSIYFDLNIAHLFFIIVVSETVLNFLKLIPIFKLKLIVPYRYYKFNWYIFEPVYKYSVKLLILGVFLFIASKSRPLILAIMSYDSDVIVGNYKIMETLMNLPIAIVGSISTIFFPKAIHLLKSVSHSELPKHIYKFLNLSNCISLLIITPIICLSSDIVEIWVGSEFQHLCFWIQIWCINAFIVLFKSPLNSFLLMKGDVKNLTLISFFSSLFLIILYVITYDFFGIGSVVISYMLYVSLIFILENIYVYNSLLGLNKLITLKKLTKSIIFLVVSVVLISNLVLFENFYLNAFSKLSLNFVFLFLFFGRRFFESNYKFVTNDI